MDFLDQVVTTQKGRLKLFTRAKGLYYVDYPKAATSISLTGQEDIYFSPHLYDKDDNILPSRTLAIDVDTADLLYLPIIPTVLISTSPDRHQAFFVFDTIVDEVLSRQLALSIPKADLSTHKFGSLFRLPDTMNTKYTANYLVHIIQNSHKTHKVEDLIPDVNGHVAYTEADLVITPNNAERFKPLATMDEYKIAPAISMQYSLQAADPLPTLRALVLECMKRGMPIPIIFQLAKASANNIFSSLNFNADRELAKFILNLAQQADKPDVRQMINRVRELTVTLEQRKQAVSAIVMDAMRLYGEFAHTKEGSLWYVPKHGGPVQIAKKSERLFNYLNNDYSLNASDIDTEHTINDLISFTAGLPQRTHETRLAHYDRQANHLIVHTGGNQVFSITTDSIELVPNGTYGIIFHPMRDIFIPFMPRIVPTNPKEPHWSSTLFDVGPFLKNVVNLNPDEARSLLAVWLMFLFFKNVAGSRPILSILGQPGSGKSTAFMRITTLLYGKISGMAGVTTPQEYDQGTSAFPLYILDNVDTWERWLPDKLAQSAGVIDVTKKKLYTDVDTVIMHRDALVALTAHDPKFSRADVADRLLILNMQRIDDDDFIKDESLLEIPRAKIWSAILLDLQNILKTPQPKIEEHLRIQDFAEIGAWIASGMGLLDHFRAALIKLRTSQRSFAIQGDTGLVEALLTYVEKIPNPNKEYKTPQDLYSKLEFLSKDPQAFTRRTRNGSALDNKLWAMQDSLKLILDIATKTDDYGRRSWLIMKK